MSDKQPIWFLQLLQGGEELAGGLPGSVHPPANSPSDGGCDGLCVQTSDRAQHEVSADGGSEKV